MAKQAETLSAYRSRRVLVSFRPNPFLRKLRGEVPEKFQAPSAMRLVRFDHIASHIVNANHSIM